MHGSVGRCRAWATLRRIDAIETDIAMRQPELSSAKALKSGEFLVLSGWL